MHAIEVWGDHPYIGAYQHVTPGDVRITSKVLVRANFLQTNPSAFGTGKWLMALLNVAGGHGLTVSELIYQNAARLDKSGDVYWRCEVHNMYGYVTGNTPIPWVGRYNYQAFYVKVYVSGGWTYYKCYVYATSNDLLYDTPAIYSWSYQSGDDNLLVGSRRHPANSSLIIKHFQYGPESNLRITETSWRELNEFGSFYYAGNWKYLAGYVCYGGPNRSSAITYNATAERHIGYEYYQGVNKEYSIDDTVCWKYTGTTIGDNKQLWSGAGTVSDMVSKPYS